VFALRNRWTSDEQIFVAGGRSRWGIRGEVARLLDDVVTVDHELAYAPTTNYWTLYRERVAFPQRFDDDRPFQRRSPIAEFS